MLQHLFAKRRGKAKGGSITPHAEPTSNKPSGDIRGRVKDRIAATSDNVLHGLRLAELSSEVAVEDSDRPPTVREFYQNQQEACILFRTSDRDTFDNTDRAKIMNEISDDHAPALKAMERRRRRDSLQSLLSIEKGLGKNYLASDRPARGNGSNLDAKRASIVAHRQSLTLQSINESNADNNTNLPSTAGSKDGLSLPLSEEDAILVDARRQSMVSALGESVNSIGDWSFSHFGGSSKAGNVFADDMLNYSSNKVV